MFIAITLLSSHPFITVVTYFTAAYVEVSDFALAAVHSDHVRFTLTLSGHLIARTSLDGSEMIAITMFAILFFGSQSVPEVS